MKKFLCAVWIALVPGMVQAAITVNTTAVEHDLKVTENWTEFFFDLNNEYSSGSEGSWFDLDGEDGLAVVKFTFASARDMLLQVTDAWQSGDIFKVFIREVVKGTESEKLTSSVPAPADMYSGFFNGDSNGPANYDTAFLDPNFSSGSWFLGAGEYEVTGLVHSQPIVYGAGAIRVIHAPVPLPASFGLMLGAGAVLGAMAARRRTRANRGEI